MEYPRKISFGWQETKALVGARKLDNKVRTARYTRNNWVPVALFSQLKRLANIYFLAITLLAFVPEAPKSPYFSLITLAIMIGFLVVKDG